MLRGASRARILSNQSHLQRKTKTTTWCSTRNFLSPSSTVSQFSLTAPSYHFRRHHQKHRQQEDMGRVVGPFVFLTTAVVLAFRPMTTTHASAAVDGKTQQEDCPFYGCPILPVDVHYTHNETIKQALEQVRSTKRVDADPAAIRTLQQEFVVNTNVDAVTLTLIGYKGGQLQEQINQDRAVIVAPYYIGSSSGKGSANGNEKRILQGVFDGHAPRGEVVSEFVATELPKRLALKLQKELSSTEQQSEERVMDTTTRLLQETFIELDRDAPADPSGGCTASVVLKQGSKIFLANAGDSRSFIVTWRPSTGMSEIVYMTREDKPDLPDERARVEAAGGQVYIPVRGTSRVVYHDPNTGAPTGLAMSRSIGDWAAGKMGVIPDPIVHVLDIDTLVHTQLYGVEGEAEIDASSNTIRQIGGGNDDVYIFSVSATDGMMDYLQESEIARIIAHALFDVNGVHPVTACEHLVFAAAQSWQEAKQGRYRDDIAIAVSTLRRPPSDSSLETPPSQ